MDRRQTLIDAFRGNDDLGAVIRSHIVIEQYLNDIIESVLSKPDIYRKHINFDYHIKVKLVIAIGLDQRFGPALNALGKLRNDFAHNIRQNIAKQDANNIYKALDTERKETVQKVFESIKKRYSEENFPNYRDLCPKDKFLLYVIALAGALEVAVDLSGSKSHAP